MIISAPSADAPMFVMGVNHEKYSSDMKGNHLDLYHLITILRGWLPSLLPLESVHCVQRGHQVTTDIFHSVVDKFRKWKKGVV